jgi:hypothetical protein
VEEVIVSKVSTELARETEGEGPGETTGFVVTVGRGGVDGSAARKGELLLVLRGEVGAEVEGRGGVVRFEVDNSSRGSELFLLNNPDDPFDPSSEPGDSSLLLRFRLLLRAEVARARRVTLPERLLRFFASSSVFAFVVGESSSGLSRGTRFE